MVFEQVADHPAGSGHREAVQHYPVFGGDVAAMETNVSPAGLPATWQRELVDVRALHRKLRRSHRLNLVLVARREERLQAIANDLAQAHPEAGRRLFQPFADHRGVGVDAHEP